MDISEKAVCDKYDLYEKAMYEKVTGKSMTNEEFLALPPYLLTCNPDLIERFTEKYNQDMVVIDHDLF